MIQRNHCKFQLMQTHPPRSTAPLRIPLQQSSASRYHQFHLYHRVQPLLSASTHRSEICRIAPLKKEGEGDTVRVHVKIKEGNRERTQVFEGFVLKIQNGGINKTFTVRRIASGVGVEKTFPVSSLLLEKVEVVQRGHVRRAKLNYMRERTGKSAKIRPSKKQNA